MLADFEAARREVRAVLDSGVFGPSSRQAKLLEYLFDKAARGQSDDLKEYTIAVELFNKPSDFDQHSDATVRVEAHRLRKKLQRFYETAGRDHSRRILLPPGQYILSFEAADPPSPNPNPDRGAVGITTSESSAKRAAARPRTSTLVLASWAVIATVAVAAVLALYYFRPAPSVRANTAAAVVPDNADRITMPDPEPAAIRILAGRTGTGYVDAAGRRWAADQFYQGGIARTVEHGVTSRTGHPDLFRTAREGSFTYRIPLQPGEYELRLYFTDPDGPGVERDPERRFKIMRVTANGEELFRGYHLAVEASYRADVRTFARLRPNAQGLLELKFLSDRGPAAVSGIEVLPMANGEIPPIRLVAQPQAFRDRQNRLWFPDDYYSGGAFGGYPSSIAGGSDPGIFSGERIGDFDYYIPAPAGEYQINVYFGEGWYGLQANVGSGTGIRVFNLLINNEPVLRRFDMLNEAPPGRLITKTFRHVRPDRSGKLHLTFAAEANFASVRAIEVQQETGNTSDAGQQ